MGFREIKIYILMLLQLVGIIVIVVCIGVIIGRIMISLKVGDY